VFFKSNFALSAAGCGKVNNILNGAFWHLGHHLIIGGVNNLQGFRPLRPL
jgi:hypothetical protein